MQLLLDHALAYATCGWPVFPCHPETKQPLLGNDRDQGGKPIPNTGGLKKASKEPDLIRQWWKRWPKAMIGVPTGLRQSDSSPTPSRPMGGSPEPPPSGLKDQNGCGLFVIDLDVPKDCGDTDGAAQTLLAEIEARIGNPLPNTAVSRTASGGMHIWFEMPVGEDGETLGNRAQLLGRDFNIGGQPANVDVRGNGGYVIVPPSIRSDGAFYEWVNGEPPEGTFASPTPALLDFVIKRYQPALGKQSGVDPRVKPEGDGGVMQPTLRQAQAEDDVVRRYALGALDAEARELARCGSGGRNHALNRAAFSLGTLIGAGALADGEVMTALRQACEQNGLAADDGWQSVEKTIASGLRGGIARPRDLHEVTAPIRLDPQPTKYPLAQRETGLGGVESFSKSTNLAAGVASDVDPWVKPADDEGRGGIWDASSGANNIARVGGGAGDGSESTSGGREQTYSTAWLNRDWALVLMGAKAAVIHEQPQAPVEDRIRVLSVEAFNAWFANKFVEQVQPDGKTKAVTWAKAWMTSKNRRQYKGLVFQPDPKTDVSAPEYLNLWRGFDLTPDTSGSDYPVLKDHLLNNVCSGDGALCDWVFGWFAHLFQKPRERPGTALVFRGKMGAGKSIVGEVMGSLVAAHYFQVDDPRYITGQFNAHMASCLLLQAEEAVWAGDKAAEGRLKGLITSKYQMIEAKGIDPIRVENYVRLMMTSNEDWVVPAGKDERRFCVLDVADNSAQNHDYFAELFEELENGGQERLLHDLLTFDLGKVDLWTIPKTAGLLEQKIRSLDSVESYWFERLWHGNIIRKREDWPDRIVKRHLFEDYIDQADIVGVRRKAEEVVFGTKLRKLAPDISTTRRMMDDTDGGLKQLWCYELPELAACRDAFDRAFGQDVDWPEVEQGRG